MSRLLTIIPYPHFFPPRNGGHLRAFYVLRELSRTHEVSAVLMQPKSDFTGKREGYLFPDDVTVYSPATSPAPRSPYRFLGRKIGPALHSRILRRSWKEPASSVILNTHHIIRDIVRKTRIDVVVFIELSSLSAAPLVRSLAPHAVCIMDMCNVDHLLLEQEVKLLHGSKRSAGTDLLRIAGRLRAQEASLPRHVNAFWATSQEDEAALANLTQEKIPGYVIPNGVDVETRPFDNREEKASSSTILFCGSLDYLPNSEGLQWFHDFVWPRIRSARPDARLRVVGRGAAREAFRSIRVDQSVEFIGEVEDVVPHYREAGVCVVPLRLGSGTRLKIPEAMSLGNPVVSTTLGAMGLEITPGVDIAIADDASQFASEVIRLMNDSIWFESIRTAARKVVDDRYDWRIIGRKMDASIQTLLPRAS